MNICGIVPKALPIVPKALPLGYERYATAPSGRLVVVAYSTQGVAIGLWISLGFQPVFE